MIVEAGKRTLGANAYLSSSASNRPGGAQRGEIGPRETQQFVVFGDIDARHRAGIHSDKRGSRQKEIKKLLKRGSDNRCNLWRQERRTSSSQGHLTAYAD